MAASVILEVCVETELRKIDCIEASLLSIFQNSFSFGLRNRILKIQMESLDILNVSFASSSSSEFDEPSYTNIKKTNSASQILLSEQQILDSLVTSFDSNESIDFTSLIMEKTPVSVPTISKGIPKKT